MCDKSSTAVSINIYMMNDKTQNVIKTYSSITTFFFVAPEQQQREITCTCDGDEWGREERREKKEDKEDSIIHNTNNTQQ